MLVLEIKNLKKYFGDRLIIKINNLKIYSEDKIGIVGLNGSGKTTLLNFIYGITKPDEGYIKAYGTISYIKQFEDLDEAYVDAKYLSKFELKNKKATYMSGGEKTKLKLAQTLSKNSKLILADEPTSNLDFESIDLLYREFMKFDGSLVLVSHDRDFLDKVCNKIIEIEEGNIKVYEGNYSKYKEQKEIERKTENLEYEKYITEKKKLEKAVFHISNKSNKIRKTPKRMGNSEARLHKMGNQNAKKTLDKTIKALETKLERLGQKEKAKEIENIKVDFSKKGDIYSRIAINAENINKSFGDKVLFKNSSFQIYNGSKTALIGNNGAGKTTLVKMILEENKGITLSKNVKIGYFSQELEILDNEKTIIENIMDSSIYDETFSRTILSRLLFNMEDIHKKAAVLSGGEKVKASFAKIILSDFNLLIFDEPTNYLDVYSIEVIEKALQEYEGTILFVSHDKKFIENIADNILYIENQEIKSFLGSFKEFKESSEKDTEIEISLIEKKAVLEYKLTEVLSKLSITSKDEEKEILDEEYKGILKELNKIRESLKTN
ncbi:ABC-F type ribosomal protection protein [Tissierella sp. MSJ-40]|uniref:ABC-F type ribosomal protection protein n=1 Tax=Tissierella simiarum TaxID=2841534 RepID=A0ABS6E4J6_9FIRM|nr:ABC-F type ribosomal protection protein [Tissierella simiarum]MBU5437834.1 ABC-F type ribosomal protection protein [Tissierella simiarum]